MHLILNGQDKNSLQKYAKMPQTQMVLKQAEGIANFAKISENNESCNF